MRSPNGKRERHTHPHTDGQHERQCKNEQRRAAGIDSRAEAPQRLRTAAYSSMHTPSKCSMPQYTGAPIRYVTADTRSAAASTMSPRRSGRLESRAHAGDHDKAPAIIIPRKLHDGALQERFGTSPADARSKKKVPYDHGEQRRCPPCIEENLCVFAHLETLKRKSVTSPSCIT